MAIKLNSITTLTERGEAHLEGKAFYEARECFGLALAQARAAGMESAYLNWRMAIALDGGSELEDALRYAMRAVSIDPFSVPFIHTRKVIARRVREALSDIGWSETAPETPRLYSMLLEIGEATAGCHVAMAGYHAAQGRPDDARKLLDAAATLFPSEEVVWAAKARILSALGDLDGAREAEAIASACGCRQIPAVARA
jgi:tetratricopeptide (TPR) repeat protein